MAITTLDGVIAGLQIPRPFCKTGITMAAVGNAQRAYTPWYATAGFPGPSTAASVGINGQACTMGMGVTVNGRFPRGNPGAGNAHMGRFSTANTTVGSLWLIDRVWQNSGLTVTSALAQPITPAALPARDAAGTTNGDGILFAIEWSATGGAGTPTVTLTYTDQSGNLGATSTFSAVANPPIGTFEIFGLAAGDTGIRAPTSFIQSATRTTGTMHLVGFRVLAMLEVSQANAGFALDAITGGMPRIYDDSVLQLLWFPSATTLVNLSGTYVETQG